MVTPSDSTGRTSSSGQAQPVAIHRQRGVQVANDHGHVMDPAECPPADLHARSLHPLARAQTVTTSRCSPQTARSRSLISPRVARAFTASMMTGTRFSRAARRAARAARALPPRPPRRARREAARCGLVCSASRCASMRCSGGLTTSSSVKRLTPDDDPFLALDLSLDPVGGILDVSLLVAGLDGGDGAAQAIDLVEVRLRGGLQVVGEGLDVVRAGQRVGRLGDAATRGPGSAACAGPGAPTPRWAARAPRRGRWCAGSASRPGPPPAPGRWCARRCCRPTARSASCPPSGRGSGTSSSAGRVAPKRSRMMCAHIRRAARNLATSSKSSLQAPKKNERRPAKASTSRPRATAPST